MTMRLIKENSRKTGKVTIYKVVLRDLKICLFTLRGGMTKINNKRNNQVFKKEINGKQKELLVMK